MPYKALGGLEQPQKELSLPPECVCVGLFLCIYGLTQPGRGIQHGTTTQTGAPAFPGNACILMGKGLLECMLHSVIFQWC